MFLFICQFVCSGVNESYQMGLFQILASILHLGNVEVKDKDSDSSIILVSLSKITHNKVFKVSFMLLTM